MMNHADIYTGIIGIHIGSTTSQVAIIDGANITIPILLYHDLTDADIDILCRIKKTVEGYLGMTPRDVVITAPSFFNLNQRQALIDDCRAVGFDCKRIITDTLAIALAQYFDRPDENAKNVAILHFEEKLIEASIISSENGVLEVKSVGGFVLREKEDPSALLTDLIMDILGKADINTGVDELIVTGLNTYHL